MRSFDAFVKVVAVRCLSRSALFRKHEMWLSEKLSNSRFHHEIKSICDGKVAALYSLKLEYDL